MKYFDGVYQFHSTVCTIIIRSPKITFSVSSNNLLYALVLFENYTLDSIKESVLFA